jgi:hypothetical protein
MIDFVPASKESNLVLNQANKFAWDLTAKIVLELYHRVIDEIQNHGDRIHPLNSRLI